MKARQYEDGAIQTTVELRNSLLSSASYIYLDDGDGLFSSLNAPVSTRLYFDSNNLFSSANALSSNLVWVKEMLVRDLYYDYGLFADVAYGTPEYFANHVADIASQPVTVHMAFVRAAVGALIESSVTLPPPIPYLSPPVMPLFPARRVILS